MGFNASRSCSPSSFPWEGLALEQVLSVTGAEKAFLWGTHIGAELALLGGLGFAMALGETAYLNARYSR
jgi:hypothetical protein